MSRGRHTFAVFSVQCSVRAERWLQLHLSQCHSLDSDRAAARASQPVDTLGKQLLVVAYLRTCSPGRLRELQVNLKKPVRESGRVDDCTTSGDSTQTEHAQ